MSELDPPTELRHLDISDNERVERYRTAGYGGSVADSLYTCGIRNTVVSSAFKPLRQGMQLVGRAIPIKLHTQVELEAFPEEKKRQEARWEADGGHPQKRMMDMVGNSEPGSVLVFDCGGDLQPAHFGEMSCQLAYAHGCRGMLIAGNCRDTQYVLKMPDFPIFSLGTRPNAYGGWTIIDVNVPIYVPGHTHTYVTVAPGDFIFGDNDGVQVIPKDYVDEVLLRVEWIFQHENKIREALAAGMPIDDVYRVYGPL